MFIRYALLAFFLGSFYSGCEAEPPQAPPPDPVMADTVFLAPEAARGDSRPTEAPGEADGMTPLHADRQRGLFAYWARLGDEVYVFALNTSGEAHSLRIDKPVDGHFEMVFMTNDDSYRVQTDATGIMLEIAPTTGMLLQRVDV
jgi:hypothetical protein